MSLSSSKLDDVLAELQQMRGEIEDAFRYGQYKEVIAIYRNTFRLMNGIRIKAIMANKRFIRYDELFPTLYSDFIDSNSNPHDIIEVIIEENGKEKRYIIERSVRRNDPFLGLSSKRSQLPEAAFLKYGNDINKKITETRLNQSNDIFYDYIIKIQKDKEKIIYNSLPTVLLIKIIPITPEVFSHFLHSSKPYTPNYPYKTITVYTSSNIKKRRIITKFKYLTTLILSEIVEQTGKSFIFKGKTEGIDYSDLDKEIFYNMSISTRPSDLEERLWYVVSEILKFLAIYGFLPSEIGFEQIGFSKGKLRFIDIGGGFDVVSKIGIRPYCENTLYQNLMNSLAESPYLKICRLDNLSQEIICRKGINPNDSINDELKGILINILNKLLDKKNVKSIIRENLDENNIEKVRNIVKEALKIYSTVYEAAKKV